MLEGLSEVESTDNLGLVTSSTKTILYYGEYKYLLIVNLLSGSGKETEHHLQLHSVSQKTNPTISHVWSVIYYKELSSCKAHFHRSSLQFLMFSARAHASCPASPTEQWVGTQSSCPHRSTSPAYSPRPATHAVLCQK